MGKVGGQEEQASKERRNNLKEAKVNNRLASRGKSKHRVNPYSKVILPLGATIGKNMGRGKR